MTKLFLTYDQQLYMLEHDKQLLISDSDYAKRMLKEISTFSSKTISIPSQYTYINHSANTHHNIPLWVATNAFTFGQISKMYQYATTDLRAKISKNFTNISEKQLLKEMGFPTNWNKITRYKK